MKKSQLVAAAAQHGSVRSAKPERRRRTQEERSEQTKQRILETSARLIREKGVGGLRTAEVAVVAGVSQGAQFHHFPNKEALILATIEFSNQKMVETTRIHASQFDSSQSIVRAIIADASDFFMSDHFFIELSLGLSGESTKQLLAQASEGIRVARFQVEEVWKARLHDLGLPPSMAANVLDLTFNLVRGFAVRTLLDANHERFETLYQVWTEIMALYMKQDTGSTASMNKNHKA